MPGIDPITASTLATGNSAINPALISGAFDLVGGLFSGRSQKRSAQRQMQFQERMSNTAYQRAMADMKKAGINPIMVTKLGGASTPTGALANVPDFGKIGSNYMQNVLRQSQATSALAQAEQQKYNAKLLKQEYDYYRMKGYPKSVGTQAPLNIFLSEYLHKFPEMKKVLFDAITQSITGAKEGFGKANVLFEGLQQLDTPHKDFDWKKLINDDRWRPIISKAIFGILNNLVPGNKLYDFISKNWASGIKGKKNK